MHFCSILSAFVLLWWQKTGRKESESQKRDNKKAKKGKLKGKRGGSVRHTNPYLQRWRLIQLSQQRQHSGNYGLWEVEGRQKAIIWYLGRRLDFCVDI